MTSWLALHSRTDYTPGVVSHPPELCGKGAVMRRMLADGRAAWLVVGLVAGLGVSSFWPHEAAYATTDRSTQFAMCSGPVGGFVGLTNPIDGVFTLDFLTGDLKWAVLN